MATPQKKETKKRSATKKPAARNTTTTATPPKTTHPSTSTPQERKKLLILGVFAAVIIILIWVLTFPYNYKQEGVTTAGPKAFFGAIGEQLSIGGERMSSLFKTISDANSVEQEEYTEENK